MTAHMHPQNEFEKTKTNNNRLANLMFVEAKSQGNKMFNKISGPLNLSLMKQYGSVQKNSVANHYNWVKGVFHDKKKKKEKKRKREKGPRTILGQRYIQLAPYMCGHACMYVYSHTNTTQKIPGQIVREIGYRRLIKYN